MNQLEIKDENMYQYFDELLYKENSKLGNWKVAYSPVNIGFIGSDIYSVLGSKELLYGREDAGRQVCLLDTMQKFLNDYIGIDGLTQLLVNNYGAIENSIFFEHDGSGKPVRIREHAKHQMKNAYLGSVLLLNFEYARDMAQNIFCAESSMTQYLVQQAVRSLKRTDNFIPDRSDILNKLEEWSYKIFMVSSMLHDIGYPLEFYLRTAAHLTDFPPYLKILSPTVKTPFSDIKALLLESQLFQQINHKEIRGKYETNNHGVLSAISLLMHFYYCGKIYSLNCEERCIIEMSAIAIYRHTDKVTEYSRMVYSQDPISYMVRLCDDLQEWERFMIQISDKHNYLICDNCGKILQENAKRYSCPCGHSYTKITQIQNRKVNYICMCDSLLLEKQDNCLKITLNFDLMKQLEILLEDYTAVLKRHTDLELVKNFVINQSISPSIQIDYYLSNNPLMIIDNMISRSGRNKGQVKVLIDELEPSIVNKNIQKFYYDFLDKIKNGEYFGEEIEKNALKYGEKASNYVKEYFGEIHNFNKLLNVGL